MFAQTETIKIRSSDKIVFPGEAILKRIPTTIGSYFEMPANCAPKPSTFLTSDEFVFGNTRIGKIENCEMIYTCVADTIRKVTIVLKDTAGVKQAGVQAGRQFGTPVYTKEGRLFVYRWNYTPRKKKALAIKLEVADDAKSAVMFVEEG